MKIDVYVEDPYSEEDIFVTDNSIAALVIKRLGKEAGDKEYAGRYRVWKTDLLDLKAEVQEGTLPEWLGQGVSKEEVLKAIGELLGVFDNPAEVFVLD